MSYAAMDQPLLIYEENSLRIQRPKFSTMADNRTPPAVGPVEETGGQGGIWMWGVSRRDGCLLQECELT